MTSTGHPSLRRTTVLAFGEQRARDSEPRVNQPEPPRASVLPDDEQGGSIRRPSPSCSPSATPPSANSHAAEACRAPPAADGAGSGAIS